MLPEALAIQPQALLCLTRFDWCPGTSVCTAAPWCQAWTFQSLHLTPFPGCVPCCGVACDTLRLLVHQALQTPLYSWGCIFRPYAFLYICVWMNRWSFRGKGFQTHQWYCFYQLQILLYVFFLCQRKNWLTWLLHSKFHSNYLWFSLITLALCPENKVLVPSVCLPLLSIKPWVIFSFLSIALPLADNDYDTFQTFVDCFKSPFNHLVQPGHIYLAPLILLYLGAILEGKILPSNNPSPSWLSRNINYSQSQGDWSQGASEVCAGQGDGEEHFTPLYSLKI